MNVRISTLSIEGFRSLRELRLTGLGRVNLITGRNNTGKSSILEALRILAFEASPTVLSSVLQLREENLARSDGTSRSTELDRFVQFTVLFAGFPAIGDVRQPVVLSANGGERPLQLSISLGLFSEEPTAEGGRRLVPPEPELFGAADLTPALVIESGSGRRYITPESFRRLGSTARLFRADLADEPRVPCVFVSPYSGEETANLGALWDRVALTDSEQYVVQALRIIVEDVQAVSMVGYEGLASTRTAIVRARSFPRPIPLRTFGDGLNRLFGIVLSLVNAKDGLLLIDEFENGMHYTVQQDVWRAIFRLARQLNVQVFATSHSWDAIEAFQQAAAEDPAEGLLIRLTRKGEAVIPTLFREDELAIATRQRIEVR